jgi:hypothetical protein
MSSTKFAFYTPDAKYLALATALDTATSSHAAAGAVKRKTVVGVYDVLFDNIGKIFELNPSDFEGIFSQAFCALSDAPSDSVHTLVARLAGALSGAEAAASEPRAKLCLSLLAVLYNTLADDSLLRYDAFRALLALARAAKLSALVADQVADLEKLSAKWLLEKPKAAELSKLAADALLAVGRPGQAQPFLFAYISHSGATGAAQDAEFERYAQLALVYTLKAPAPAVSLSPVAAYDALAALEGVATLEAKGGNSAALAAAVKLLASGSVQEYLAFAATPAAAAAYAAHGIDAEAVLLNVRALNLAAAVRPGTLVKYEDAAASACPDLAADVEEILVDIVALGQVSARLNQQARTVRVDKIIPRGFNAAANSPAWKELSDRVGAWHAAVNKAITTAPELLQKATLV